MRIMGMRECPTKLLVFIQVTTVRRFPQEDRKTNEVYDSAPFAIDTNR